MALYLFASGLLTFSFFFTVAGALAVLLSFFPGKDGRRTWDFLFQPTVMTTALAVLLTVQSAILLYAFINHDFIVKYVAGYSDKTLPLFYRITAFWAGQAGSLLFWAWSVALGGALFVLLPAYKRLGRSTQRWHCLFFFCIMAFFLLLLDLWSNPFDMSGVPPQDGQGLNPLLQNPGMIFHPPLLFLGYGGFVAPGCLALAQTLSGRLQGPASGIRLEESWGQATRPFILIAWSLLTAGIVLGAWWAYMELGWGGYWAWDPVENASLIPWLVGTAYLHTAVIESRRGKLRRTNVLLMALTTISAFFATYLVRSGVVQSLHAFGDGGVGTPLLLFTLIFLFLSLFIAVCAPVEGAGKKNGMLMLSWGLAGLLGLGFLLACHYGLRHEGIPQYLLVGLPLGLLLALLLGATSDPNAKPLEDLSSREGLLLIVAWLLLALSFLILVATMWPVFVDMLLGVSEKLPDALRSRLPQNPQGLAPSFYNRTCLPLFGLFAMLLAVCPFRNWKIRAAEPKARNRFLLLFWLPSTLAVAAVCVYFFRMDELAAIFQPETPDIARRALLLAAQMILLSQALVLPLLLAASLFLTGGSAAYGFSRPRTLAVGLSAFLLLVFALAHKGYDHPLVLLAAGCAGAAILGITLYFAGNPQLLRVRSSMAAHGVHVGLLLVVLGVAFSGPYQNSHELLLTRQQPVAAGKYRVMLNEMYEGESQVGPDGRPNFIFLEAELLVTDSDGNYLGTLSPQLRQYSNFSNQRFTEVSTRFSLGNELYATLHGVDQQFRASVMFNINPLVNWLWIGGTLMCLFPFAGLGRIRRPREDDAEADAGSQPPQLKSNRGR